MSNALIVVLALVLVAALAALIVILRRQTTAPALDENAIRRLLTESIDASAQRETAGQHAVPTDQLTEAGRRRAAAAPSREDRLALDLIRQETAAAAAEIRKAAADAADAVRERSLSDAAQDAGRGQGRSGPRRSRRPDAEAAALQAGIKAERQRMAQEALDALAVERTELEQTQHAAARRPQRPSPTSRRLLAVEQERVRVQSDRSSARPDLRWIRRESDLRRQAAELAHQSRGAGRARAGDRSAARRPAGRTDPHLRADHSGRAGRAARFAGTGGSTRCRLHDPAGGERGRGNRQDQGSGDRRRRRSSGSPRTRPPRPSSRWFTCRPMRSRAGSSAAKAATSGPSRRSPAST